MRIVAVFVASIVLSLGLAPGGAAVVAHRTSHRTVSPPIAQHRRSAHPPARTFTLAEHRAHALAFLAALGEFVQGRADAAVPQIVGDDVWWQIALVETGGDVTAHSSTYSSVFGVLNGRPGGRGGVVNEADDPASAARILAGTASYREQLRMARREAAEFGIHAWNDPVADALP